MRQAVRCGCEQPAWGGRETAPQGQDARCLMAAGLFSAENLSTSCPRGWTEGMEARMDHTSPPCRSSQVLLVRFLTGALAGGSQGFATRGQEE